MSTGATTRRREGRATPGVAALGAQHLWIPFAQKRSALAMPRPQSPSPPVAVVCRALGERNPSPVAMPVLLLYSSPVRASQRLKTACGRRITLDPTATAARYRFGLAEPMTGGAGLSGFFFLPRDDRAAASRRHSAHVAQAPDGFSPPKIFFFLFIR